MVFLEGNPSEPEIVSEKVLLTVTLGGAKYSGTYMFYCRCLFFHVTLLPKLLLRKQRKGQAGPQDSNQSFRQALADNRNGI
jgi:hypothetical protein